MSYGNLVVTLRRMFLAIVTARHLLIGKAITLVLKERQHEPEGTTELTAYSAGSHPAGFVRPETFKQIAGAGLSTDGFYSKSWDEFAKPGAPPLNFVFTVCDNAAKEVCPVWPGQPLTAHWGVHDPAAVIGTPEEIERAFRDTFSILDRRISLFLSLPLATLDQLALQKEVDEIGHQ